MREYPDPPWKRSPEVEEPRESRFTESGTLKDDDHSERTCPVCGERFTVIDDMQEICQDCYDEEVGE